MTPATERTILRWIHIIFGLMLIGYVYGRPEDVLPYRDNFRFIFFPVVLLSGLWMWKGHLVRGLFSKKNPA